jgi:PAS domain S-box-containing protein
LSRAKLSRTTSANDAPLAAFLPGLFKEDIRLSPPAPREQSSNEMMGLVLAKDWSKTPLGPRETWSASLTLAVDLVLRSGFGMALRWGPDFVLIYNDGYKPILGDKHPRALGLPVREAWPEVWSELEPNHTAILSGRSPGLFFKDILYRIQRRGSEWDDAHFTVSYSPVHDETAPTGVGGVQITAIETTVHVAAEKALAARAAEFQTFAQVMPNHVWSSAPDGLLNWFNDRVYAYSGAARGTLDGQGWARLVHPDDLADAAERWGAALKSGEPYETQFRLKRADGTYRWHLGRARPIRGPAGEIERWIGTNTDIEDQKASAEALAILNVTLEQQVADRTADRDRMWRISTDLMLVAAMDGTITAVNPAWRQLLGWQESELIGKTFLEFVHPDDIDATLAEIARLDAGKTTFHFENRYRRKDGSYRTLAWTAVPGDGLLHGVARDVTAEREASEALRRTEETLRQSQKMEAVGQLTGGIAHDFNNMLTVVGGSLELLGRRLPADDERSHRYIDSAVEGVRRASTLTQRLLAFSRQQPLKPEAIDLNKLVSGMSDLLRHSLGTAIRLETALAGGLWRTHVDPNQLENVILSLAVNGRDAMPDGGGRLTIETQNAHLDTRYVASHTGVPEGQYVLVAVTDTGSGMPPDVIAKAFDPFFTTKDVGKGTGLGLSQVYGFVKQSGGHVKIYSERGQGTTVKIYLPRLLSGDPTVEAVPEKVEIPLGDLREVVLVVEDEPGVRRFSVEALRELGYRVLEADGAAAALRLIDQHPEIALMFTDVVMPDVNGRKLTDEAHRRRPGLKVLYTTGYTRNAVVHNGVLDAGVQMIGKPFSIEELAGKVRKVLDTPA